MDEYSRRLPKDWKLDLLELKPESRNTGKSTEQILLTERDRIQAALPKGARLVALDERGLDITSHKLAQKLGQWHDAGEQLCLVIGSADGLHADIKQQAHEQWRLSSLTLPHAMARILLTEALYRAWSILSNHPYHRD
jgi:23S rRNA (pseudouridine1915-N3)-methyltransferase